MFKLDFDEIYELLITHKVDLNYDLSKKLLYFFALGLKKDFTIFSNGGKEYQGKVIIENDDDYVSIYNKDKDTWNDEITISDFIHILRQ
jgi:hypothetical protein